MGRIKVFLRSFCLNGCIHRSNDNDPTYNSGIDVSHLATPHITIPQILDETLRKSTPNLDNEENEKQNHFAPNGSNRQTHTPSSCAISTNQHQQLDGISCSTREADDNGILVSNSNIRSASLRTHETVQQQRDNIESPSSPSSSNSSCNHMNLYNEVTRSRDRSTPDLPHLHQQQQQQHQNNNRQQPQDHHSQNVPTPPSQVQPVPPPREQHQSGSSDAAATKLSYDIISVREPLAKILAERQQLLQAQAQQQQQRQLIGDHEYIEVYGERGSSCFYEEIAGSVTSSATYDQIGAVSNHNYQVLINSYAVANSRNVGNNDCSNGDNREVTASRQSTGHDQNLQNDHTYDVTNPSDQVDGPVQPSGQSFEQTNSQRSNVNSEPQLSQSVAIYSVINKATKRSSSGLRNTTTDNISERPPRPPPKNLLNYNQKSNIVQPLNVQNPSNSKNSSVPSPSRVWLQAIPSTSTCTMNSNAFSQSENAASSRRDDLITTHIPTSQLPQPPPRYHRQPNGFSTTDRPLPSPNTLALSINNNNNANISDRNLTSVTCEDDSELINNGYELLRSNLEDELIDVGYEKIRESNRYSGGSLSSQFYPMPLVDNGGYESVQPIYSSPSMAEPNYEAIAPATASELAAAATAKLTAAATVIEQSRNNNSQTGPTMI